MWVDAFTQCVLVVILSPPPPPPPPPPLSLQITQGPDIYTQCTELVRGTCAAYVYWLTQSLTHSHIHSLTHWVSLTLSHTHAHLLTHSRTHSPLTHSHSLAHLAHLFQRVHWTLLETQDAEWVALGCTSLQSLFHPVPAFLYHVQTQRQQRMERHVFLLDGLVICCKPVQSTMPHEYKYLCHVLLFV